MTKHNPSRKLELSEKGLQATRQDQVNDGIVSDLRVPKLSTYSIENLEENWRRRRRSPKLTVRPSGDKPQQTKSDQTLCGKSPKQATKSRQSNWKASKVR